jgi:transposase-like protein
MDDLIRLLVELLARNTLKVEMKFSLEESDRGDERVTCKYCGWNRSYDTKSAAKRGLRAHRQHCAKMHLDLEQSPVDLQWIRDLHKEENKGE